MEAGRLIAGARAVQQAGDGGLPPQVLRVPACFAVVRRKSGGFLLGNRVPPARRYPSATILSR